MSDDDSVAPLWRSFLFVPALAEHRLARAHLRGADALIVDLEDSISPERKELARRSLPQTVAMLSSKRQQLIVRINAPERHATADLEVAARPGVSALMVPKVECASQLEWLSRMLDQLEGERGLTRGGIGLIALLETPAGFGRIWEIVRASRLVGLALGSEDLGAALGAAPTAASLIHPCQMIALAAASRQLMAIGYPASIASFSELEELGRAARAGRAIGMTGGLCVHPTQVGVINAAFTPTPEEIERAERICAAWRLRGEQDVLDVEGLMVDGPVAARAEGILDLYRRVRGASQSEAQCPGGRPDAAADVERQEP